MSGRYSNATPAGSPNKSGFLSPSAKQAKSRARREPSGEWLSALGGVLC